MTNECRCGRPTRDAAYVCDTCADALSIALGDVTWLDEELETTITRQRGIPTEGGGSSSTETALPWHEKASDARRNLHGLLATWCRFCDEEDVRNQSPLDGLPADNLQAMSGYLLWRVDGLTLHDIGLEAVDEITNAVAECERLIDRRPDRWYAGPCTNQPVEGLDATCQADLYAKRATGSVECRQCGAVYDVAQRRTWLLAEAEDRLADATTVARALSWLGAEALTPARIWKWAERGRIVVKGHDGKRPLYRIGDAIDILANDTQKVG